MWCKTIKSQFYIKYTITSKLSLVSFAIPFINSFSFINEYTYYKLIEKKPDK